ncbi:MULTISPECIES: isochorismatase family cysteine hydrolase [Francisella]|uniref:Cysteine hydrolase n=1 Tax=Francisella opportunistica TaxID=2016517 RepID=A0A345JRG0_9GAMM|nr:MULTISPECIES: isochorismatase family cysteine hydrolase [Francisella]APC91634.1 Nicotinamidase [Francisella sp. MA067296]AXH29906.1 cysteine hydrolase [Francisella opportunistica]AXH31553.1 cysteine hydrolase [Francisella opportunistica]AXH33201.1 cysteine hydrolase [Francisella opportunistica]
MPKNALVVVDVQNYFVNEHTKILPKKIRKLIQTTDFDYIVFSKYVNNLKSNHYKILKWHECQESPDIDIHAELLEFTNSKNVFEKNSYSIFKSTMLDFFKEKNINKIYLAGIDIDACVLASAFDGFDLGYDIEILKDFCLSHFGKGFKGSALKIMQKNLVYR